MVGSHATATRRSVLRASAAGITLAHAGCLQGNGTPTPASGSGGDTSAGEGRVYVPQHVHEVRAADRSTTGEYAISLLYSSPDFFWRIDGSEAAQVEPEGTPSIQLLAWLWDPETGTVLPGAGVTATVEREGEVATKPELLPMLTQRRGVHYARNISLSTYGEYSVTLQIGGVDARRTRGFVGRLGSATADLVLPFERGRVESIETTYLEQAGTEGAVKPMQSDEMPLGIVDPSGLPGDVVATETSGAARVAVLSVGAEESPLEDDRPYLAVVPTTPFNRYLLPLMRVAGRVTRDDSSVFEGTLPATLDPELGYHYGAGVDSLEGGDRVRVSFPRPPQIARFAGYERAFLDMGEMTTSL